MSTPRLSMLKLCFLCVSLLLLTNDTAGKQQIYQPDYQEWHIQDLADTPDMLDIGLYKRSKDTYCGKHLLQQMQLVCKGVYKRRAPESDEMTIDDEMPAPDMDLAQFPFMTRHAALKMKLFSMPNKRGRGIVEECCRKSCSRQHMMSYCG